MAGAYWFGATVSGFALLCAAAVIPSSANDRTSGRLDWLGTVLLTLALVTTLVAVTEGTEWGWDAPATIGLLVAGIVFFAVWTRRQLRTKHPLVQLRLLRLPSVLSADTCAMVLGIAMYMALSGITEFVQSPRSSGFGFSASAVIAGLTLLPLSLFMLASSRVLPILARRLGMRAVLTMGCLASALGCGFFAVFQNQLWQTFITTGILGMGLGITFAAIPSLITQAVPTKETGSAIGFFQLIRFTGYTIGSALTATILASHTNNSGQPSLDGYTFLLWTATGICVLATALA